MFIKRNLATPLRKNRGKAEVLLGGITLLMALALINALSDSYADADTKSNRANSVADKLSPTAGGKILFARLSQGSGDLWVVNSDGTNPMQITSQNSYFAPDWSPEGTQIVVQTNSGYSQIYKMDADGTNQVQLTHGDVFSVGPSWSPLGNKIAFARAVDGTNVEVFTMNTDGSNQVRLTNNDGEDAAPDWSPDGTQIVFQSEQNDSTQRIFKMNANGSNQVQLTNPSDGTDSGPRWSPVGNKIAFTRHANSNFDIFVMNADGSNEVNLTSSQSVSEISPNWSPDGTQIVYSAVVAGNPERKLYVMNADGSNRHVLLNPPSGSGDATPSWANSTAKVLVQGTDGLPVEGALIYRKAGVYSDPIGTTNISGTLVLTSPVQPGDQFVARKQVYEGATQKGGHDGWAYHVWLTNINENDDGTETAYTVTDTARITHTLTILPTNVQIGFNIVASVEYNDTDDHLREIQTGFNSAQDDLMDVTDGQMYFEQVKIYDAHQHWDDADFQFQLANPRASADVETDGISALTSPDKHIYMYGPNDFGITYNQQSAYYIFLHEFAHYAIGASDEYYKFNTDDYPTQCAIEFDNVDYDVRASIMFDQRSSSEFCSTIEPVQHNPDTAQGYIHGESVWQTFLDNWSDENGLWQLRSPMTRGVVDPGPLPTFDHGIYDYWTMPEIINSPPAPCRPSPVTALLPDGRRAVGADFGVLYGVGHDWINEGVTDGFGMSTAYGAVPGDSVYAQVYSGTQLLNNGETVVTNCTDPLTITLLPSSPVKQGEELEDANEDRGEHTPGFAWPLYWVEAVPDWAQTQITITLNLSGDPPAQPILYASQDLANRQQLSLTYNPSLHQFTSSYIFDPARTPAFRVELELPNGSISILSAYDFSAGQFHIGGPAGYEKMKNLGSPHGNDPNVPPQAWNLFRAESAADIIVNPSSLPDSTGVMIGRSGMPVGRPDNLVAVGGPYSIQGQNAISGEVGITLAYQSEHFCGLVPGSVSIYRYTGTGWQAIPTSLIDEWHQAGGKISQWGIYGVFGQPNPQTTFSDVPSGSTFYDYIGWITCHGIASGYSDGTFRPNNNATRGQISKMMALTYKWLLEPPANGYTFADVLPGSTFYLYVEAVYREGVVSGYACGGAGEPCDSQNRPYFRPSNNVTRGQIAKVISNGSRFNDVVSGQTFEDVAIGSTFYEFVGRMASRSIINGYACGGAGEPCGGGNRPYFRPQNNATRGQLSKMIYLAAQPR